MFIHHERERALDRFGLGFGAEHGFGARELRLIKLEMFVSDRGGVSAHWVGGELHYAVPIVVGVATTRS